MKRNHKIICLALLFMLFASLSVSAQNSLFDNPKYRRSLDLQRMSKAAYDSGDYLSAGTYAQEAETLSLAAREEAETQLQKWIANSWKNRAASRIAFGEKVRAPERYPDIWPQAQEAFALAQGEYDALRFTQSTEASKQVVGLLADIKAELPPAAVVKQPEIAQVEPTPKPEPEPEPVAEAPPPVPVPEPVVLPAYYVVRLIESARDCFWRIAGYPFVYGDPLEWPILYEANKDKIPQPDNPHLIQPGMLLAIPPREGEKREGTWKE